jgi:hypothetical protein
LESQLKIFEATIDDRDHVVITRQLPGIAISVVSREVVAEKADLKQAINGVLILGPEILLESDHRATDTVMLRLGLQEEILKTKLAMKAIAVEPSQRDHCSILVTFGEWADLLVFPFPVNVEKSRVRISRKQSYIDAYHLIYFILQNFNANGRFWSLRGFRCSTAVIR